MSLTVPFVVVMYTSSARFTFGFCRIRGDTKIFLRSWKICSHCSFHENFVDFFKRWIMGRVLSASLGRNVDIAVRWSTKRCTSLTFVGLRIWIIAF